MDIFADPPFNLSGSVCGGSDGWFSPIIITQIKVKENNKFLILTVVGKLGNDGETMHVRDFIWMAQNVFYDVHMSIAWREILAEELAEFGWEYWGGYFDLEMGTFSWLRASKSIIQSISRSYLNLNFAPIL